MEQHMANIQEDEIEIDLRELFFVLMSRIWSIIICVVAGVVIAAAITVLAITPMYKSTSIIYIKTSTDLASVSMADLQVSSALTYDYVLLVTSRPVVNKVIANLELDMTYEQLSGQISAVNPQDTHFITITVKNEDPYMAKMITDELTEIVIKRTAEIMETNEPKVVEEGTLEENQVSPSLKKNVVIGGAVGLVLSVLVIVIAYLLNDSIKTTEDVERYLGLDTLGTIPMEEGQSKKAERRLEEKRHKMRMKAERKSAGRRGK